MEDKKLWTRRKFSKAILSLQALITSGILSAPIGCNPNKNDNNGSSIEDKNRDILVMAMNEIIPQSDSMPSASQAGGLKYILDILNEHPGLAPGFTEVLNRLNAYAKEKQNDDFKNLSSQLRVDVLKHFELKQSELFSVLKHFVYESYYVNEKIWKLIGYEPYPTLSTGPEMEPFDENLLERVKNHTKLYIETKT